MPSLQDTLRTLSGTTQQLSPSGQPLTGSSGGGTKGSGPSGSGSGSSGSTGGPGGFGSGGPGGGSAGSSGAGGSGSGGPGAAPQAAALGSILDYLGGRKGGGRRGGRIDPAVVLAQLREALTQLEGCFYGLSGRERRVLTLRAGLNGRRPHSRSDVAGRLNTSRGQVRRTERSALLKLDALAQSTGCATGSGAAAGAAMSDGFVTAAELALAPQLVTLANPAYQGLRQTRFSRLGAAPNFASRLPLSSFGDGSKSGGLWALQLLAIMLALGLVGLVRGFPAMTVWLRARREGVPARVVAARSPRPAPHPVHRQSGQAPPEPEGTRPPRRQIQA